MYFEAPEFKFQNQNSKFQRVSLLVLGIWNLVLEIRGVKRNNIEGFILDI